MSSINFINTTTHNKTVQRTPINNITKTECKVIYNNIQQGLPIKNPRTGKSIVYHSPITQKILKTCYTKYKMTQLPNVINPRNLFGNATPPQLSPSSNSPPGSRANSPPGSRANSPPGAKVNSQPGSKVNSQPGSRANSPPGSKVNSQPGSKVNSPPGAKVNSQPGSKVNSQPGSKVNSPPGAKAKLSFANVADTIKKSTDKKKFEKITEEQCRNVINQIATNKPIENPLTGYEITKTSGITKYILYHCYYTKNIKEVEDVVNVNTLGPKPSSTKISVQIPNIYNDIYNKFNDLRSNYSEQKLYDLIIESEILIDLTYFINYIESCKKIEKQQTITYEQLTTHINHLLSLCEINTKNKIMCYDDIFLNDFALLKSKNIITESIQNNKFNIDHCYFYEDIYKNNLNPYTYDENDIILLNAAFNRIYIFNYNTNFTFAPNNKYIFKLKNPQLLNNIISENNKTLPKYFAHNFIDKTETNNKLNYLTAFLNCFSQDFLQNIEITENESIKKFSTINALFPNIKTRECEDLTTILFNNTSFNLLKILMPITANNFDGTICHSTVDKNVYLYNLLNYQSYNIPLPDLLNISKAYKNYGIRPFSTDLNNALSNFVNDPNIEISDEIKTRIMKTFDFINQNYSEKSINYDKSIFVFHGTSGKLNSDTITALLSTSFNINIAITYASHNINPHIYVFRINTNTIKYINFNDNLQQLLLLPGTKIIEKGTLNNSNYTFILCDIEIPHQNYIKKLIHKIKTYKSKYRLTSYPIKIQNYTNDYINVISYPTNIYNNNTIFRNTVYKTYDNKYLFCNMLQESANKDNVFLNLKYTIHQLIINNIYSYFLTDNIIKYNLLDFNNGKILTGWKYDNTLINTANKPDYKYDFNFIIIDILCNNFDLANKISYLITTDNKVKKVWFKTTGIFNGVALQTITSDDTDSLNTIFEKDKNTIINNTEIYKNNKQDIKPFVDKYIALIQQFKTDNIINKIIENYTDLIDNVLDIPQSKEEYKDIKILLDTIQKYFNAKVDYMLALNKNDLILQINNKMSLLGGKDKKLSSSSLDKSIIPKKSNKKQQEYMDTNPTTYDEYSYEITPQYYSSSQTISSKSFEAIYKKYYT